jgi:hypothetical protein
MSSRASLVLVGALLSAPTAALGQGGGKDRSAQNAWVSSGRDELVSFERRLEDAVGRVSVPHAGILLGRTHASRGYRLPGYGVVFVLTPRSLPGEDPVFVMRRHSGRGETGVHAEPPGPHHGDEAHWVPERVEEFERKVLVLQHQAEARRRAAEEDMDRIVKDIRVRLELEDEQGSATRQEQEQNVSVRVDSPVPPDQAPPVVEELREPPWKFWLRLETDEERRSPDRIVEDVRSAVVGALDARAGAAAGLRGEEFVTVAVDFVPGDLFASHRQPSRTLIVRARQRDLEAHARGEMAREELHDRVEVIEY